MKLYFKTVHLTYLLDYLNLRTWTVNLQHNNTYLLEEENTHPNSKSGSHVVCRTAQLKYLFTLLEMAMWISQLLLDVAWCGMLDHFE